MSTPPIEWLDSGITAPQGYRASGVAAGIKPNSTKQDCALVISTVPATLAGMFTTNVMRAAPVEWNAERCAMGMGRAVFINSGNANAVTGDQGHADVRTTAEAVAEAIGCTPEEVAICSTGVIGVPLPMERILKGVEESFRTLRPEGGQDAALAIMTTDTVPKEVAAEVTLSSGKVRIGCMAKGSGMIAPNMATMIAVITTDATVAAPELARWLREAVAVSFNAICIDNDMSTSDTVLAFANGAAGLPAIEADSPDAGAFRAALTAVCEETAKRLVRDGEGATKLVAIEVSGAPSEDDAKTICRAIAHSQLCKTAFFGQDANWGRFACAAGYAGVGFEPGKLSIWLDGVQLLADGQPTGYAEGDAAAVMKQPEFTLRVRIGEGPGEARFWTSDLSHGYVSINADYRT